MDRSIDPSSITGVILAGGRAQRMNDLAKGNILIGRLSIIERLINEFHQAGINDLILVTNNAKSYDTCGLPVIPDLRPGIGPLAGVEAGLNYYQQRAHAVIFVPCDLPNISAAELIKLKESYMNTKAPVIFAQTGAFFWHPLCAVVHIDMLEPVTQAINDGCRKISDVWQQIGGRMCSFADEGPFFNINTPTDLETWRKHYEGSCQ